MSGLISAHTTWQSLMDGAYAKRETTLAGLSYGDFLEEITGTERKAVLLGNLNYQVENGGFSQWVDNGYGLHLHAVKAVLDAVGTESARKASEILNRLAPVIDFERLNGKRGKGGRSNWLATRKRDRWSDDEGDGDAAYELCETLDGEYYAINKELMADIEEFFCRKAVAVKT